jgi:hypothetical protein
VIRIVTEAEAVIAGRLARLLRRPAAVGPGGEGR